MTRLASLDVKTVGTESFGLSNYNKLKSAHDYLVVAGGDKASGATVTIDSEFHGLTGTTTVDNLADASGAAAGQQIGLLIKNGPVIFRNQGGGTGNIRTSTGADKIFPQNAIVAFVFDGTVWREQVAPAAGAEIDFKSVTADVTGITATTEGAAVAVITGNSVAYAVERYKLEASLQWLQAVSGTGTGFTAVWFRGATAIGQHFYNSSAVVMPSKVEKFDDNPAAGTFAYSLKAFGNGTLNWTVKAGAGGAGALNPIFLRVTRA